MEEYKIQIFQSLAVIAIILFIKLVIRTLIIRIIDKFKFNIERKHLIDSIFNIFIFIFGFIAITAIWSVKPEQFFVFLTSILTVIGVAFFAQWSILSNVTATVILFFNHPLKVGGYVKISDKDYPIEGHVEKMSFFFLYIKTVENQLVTIPSSVALQKIIVIDDIPAAIQRVDNKEI